MDLKYRAYTESRCSWYTHISEAWEYGNELSVLIYILYFVHNISLPNFTCMPPSVRDYCRQTKAKQNRHMTTKWVFYILQETTLIKLSYLHHMCLGYYRLLLLQPPKFARLPYCICWPQDVKRTTLWWYNSHSKFCENRSNLFKKVWGHANSLSSYLTFTVKKVIRPRIWFVTGTDFSGIQLDVWNTFAGNGK
jgi:hypothetical protein